jgi:hypothetical protein
MNILNNVDSSLLKSVLLANRQRLIYPPANYELYLVAKGKKTKKTDQPGNVLCATQHIIS